MINYTNTQKIHLILSFILLINKHGSVGLKDCDSSKSLKGECKKLLKT